MGRKGGRPYSRSVALTGDIEQRILVFRGQKVMIDRDLGELYGVETKYLNRQVKRNADRFPQTFMFQLDRKEKDKLVTKCHRFISMKHASSLPYAFTEYGVAMLASLLRSKHAVKISVDIIETFIRLRHWVMMHKELALRVSGLEKKAGRHDRNIQAILEAMKEIMREAEKPKRRIGFR